MSVVEWEGSRSAEKLLNMPNCSLRRFDAPLVRVGLHLVFFDSRHDRDFSARKLAQNDNASG